MRAYLRYVPIALLAVAALVLLARSSSEPAQAGGTTFIVNNPGDGVDPSGPACDDSCILREAISQANMGQGNTIAFDLPGCPGTPANCVIHPASELDPITQPFTIIDGTTQAGYAGEPIVGLAYGGILDANGLVISEGAVIVKGLSISGFTRAGIYVDDSSSGIVITDNAIFENAFDGITLGAGLNYQINNNTIVSNGQSGVDGEECPGSSQFISNDILYHGTPGQAALQICGAANEAHFNRFTDNVTAIDDLTFGGTLNAENNWFGCNEGPAGLDCDPVLTIGSVDSDPWLTLSLEASPNPVFTSGTSALAATLTRNSDGADVSATGAVKDGSTALFETDLGTVGSFSIAKDMVAGVAEATLTAPPTPGTAHVSATHSFETVTIDVGVTEPPFAQLQGDVNCDGDINGRDILRLLILDSGIAVPPIGGCPDIGSGSPGFANVNCDDEVDIGDIFAIMQFVAGVEIEPPQPGGCTPIGQPLPA